MCLVTGRGCARISEMPIKLPAFLGGPYGVEDRVPIRLDIVWRQTKRSALAYSGSTNTGNRDSLGSDAHSFKGANRDPINQCPNLSSAVRPSGF